MGGEVGLPPPPASVELFSGCGGLALGVARAGFRHRRLVEWNGDACDTLELNRARGVEHAADWAITKGDVREVDWHPFQGVVALVAGGPPCQPFSIGGKHQGREDRRDMWPEAIRAVAEMAPSAFLFENVRGLIRPAFAAYLQGVTARLANPREAPGEGIRDGDVEYDVRVLRLNAADFGAAQKRHRVVIAGFRRDLDIRPDDLRRDGLRPDGPAPTHSRDRLLWDQWVTGDYWTRHGLARSSPARLSVADAKAVARLASSDMPPETAPWVTVRDCLFGLGEPSDEGDRRDGHVFQPGARVYTGHTGSPPDEPAKALKAGDHGVPGGENMMVRDDGTVRYFTVREAARLQGLPDDWRFSGAWSECMRQLGNAVPVPLAEAVARWIADVLMRR